MDEAVFLVLDPDFPLDDVEKIAVFLRQAVCLVPGYIPPDAGLLDVLAIDYTQNVQGFELFALPDRNLVSRMAKVAREGSSGRMDHPTRIAASLMAYCQCLNIHIEPSIAFHELASRVGNDDALAELGWFRAADQANPLAWVDLALGRSTQPVATNPEPVACYDLQLPLRRWRRNYIAALKIAELELSNRSPPERMIALLDWMMNDFLLAGPAAILAAVYFSPRAQRGGMFKRLRSLDQTKALEGVRNEAWDITHLSDFVRKAQDGEGERRRYVFATADKRLAKIAPLLLSCDPAPELERTLAPWWSQADASSIARKLADCLKTMQTRPPPAFEADTVSAWIERGERSIQSLSAN